jgi:hypothetical protein
MVHLDWCGVSAALAGVLVTTFFYLHYRPRAAVAALDVQLPLPTMRTRVVADVEGMMRRVDQ